MLASKAKSALVPLSRGSMSVSDVPVVSPDINDKASPFCLPRIKPAARYNSSSGVDPISMPVEAEEGGDDGGESAGGESSFVLILV